MTANRRRVSLGLFLCGLVTFGAVYSGQSLLPVLATAWRITPGEASLTVSVTTGALAVFVIPASLLADRLGRSRAMAASVLAGSVLTLAGAASKSYPMLLVLRGLAGVAFAGVVAVAMGYLAEQVPAGQLGSAAGLYVAGNSVGGMVGRVLSATGDLLGWRAALAIAGLLALVGAFAAVRILPASAPHADRPPAPLWPLLKQNLSDLVLLRLCLIGGLAISAFVTAYNFLGFRLLAAPFALPATLVGLIFLTYVAGTAGSAICGRLTDRFPHRYVLLMTAAVAALAAVLTLPDSLPLILIGLIALTAGFFASNSAATAAVGQPPLPRRRGACRRPLHLRLLPRRQRRRHGRRDGLRRRRLDRDRLVHRRALPGRRAARPDHPGRLRHIEPSAGAGRGHRSYDAGMTSHARLERTALVEAMREVGPDAPTLCTGWTTRDLAAHLVIRERRPDSSLGILLPQLAGYTERVRTQVMEAKSYEQLLDLIDSGAWWSPTGNPLADGVVNLAEFFIHHEDVRRAQPEWGPRAIPADVEQKFWSNLRIMAPLALRRAPVGVLLTANGGRTIRPNRAASRPYAWTANPASCSFSSPAGKIPPVSRWTATPTR
ncbi:TIGR03085 family metal-binding protein [Fodinicola feengrottensis]|uniref:TIGR03085 family metal-binding protein n=1 Tax=Fodinicola feengrottensis TaxID=435914 RepID=UPI002442538B|nr:TIGR03085 family metal-binding protein [Fodinicola feengrottensis]